MLVRCLAVATFLLVAAAPALRAQTVTQGVQQRIVQTDSIGRSVLASEPESGTTTYAHAYNALGLLTTRTKPAPNQTDPNVTITTATQNDALGRPVSIAYNGTVAKTFGYDSFAGGNLGRGRLTSAATAATAYTGVTGYSAVYDSMGNITSNTQCFPGQCGQTGADVTRSYHYDWMGRPYQDDYVATNYGNRTVHDYFSYSVANEVQSIFNSVITTLANSGMVLSNVVNGPSGPVSYQLGNQAIGNESYDANGRNSGRTVCLSTADPSCNGGTTLYSTTQQVKGLQISSSSDSIVGQNNAFTYDDFNRLQTAAFPTQGNTLAYAYDRYGNRWSQTVTQGQGTGNANQFSPTFNLTNNQISQAGYVYDAAGALRTNIDHTYTYDPEGNLIAVDGGTTATYTFDAFNRRVQAVANGFTTDYGYDAFGQRTSIYDGSGTTPVLRMAATFWNGRPIQVMNMGTTPKASYYHQDLTGTARVISRYDGTSAFQYISAPYGDLFSATATRDDLHFAGLDYDAEIDSHHAQFREYSPTQGRWFSPDPYGGSYNQLDPQSFNRYAYVQNSPLVYSDPAGLDGFFQNGSCLYYYQTSFVDGKFDSEDTFFVSCSTNATGGGSAGGGGGGASAPNNSDCVKNALLSNAANLAIDAAGAIVPGVKTFGTVGRIIGAERGYATIGRAYQGIVADQIGAKAIKSVTGSAGAASGLASITDTSGLGLASTAFSAAALIPIPIVSQIASIGSLGLDAYKTYKAVSACHN